MTPTPPTALSPEDAALLDHLIAGRSLAEVIDADDPRRAERVSRLLSLLDRWEAGDPKAGLAHRTLSTVITASPMTLSIEDGRAMDALLSLRRQGLEDGPMPAQTRERIAGLRRVTDLLDRAGDEAMPTDLAQRTLQTIERDRRARQRSAMSIGQTASHRQSPIGIRQIATTAALFILGLSILLPMLSNAKRDAQIAQCGQNLAGLGSDLQQIAFDHRGQTYSQQQTYQPAQPSTFNPLARFARTGIDGSPRPASQAGYFVILDQQRIASQHLACPSGSSNDPAALYNGQNPAAGGPFRVFLKPRPIFADANPLYRVTEQGLVRNTNIPTLSPSSNHNGAGQNVLISDGSVRWMIRPAVQRDGQTSDNIWLYQPDRQNTQNDDIFLTP